MQNSGKLLSVTYPHITVRHGAEHVVSLFFSDIFTNVSKVHIQFILNYKPIGASPQWQFLFWEEKGAFGQKEGVTLRGGYVFSRR